MNEAKKPACAVVLACAVALVCAVALCLAMPAEQAHAASATTTTVKIGAKSFKMKLSSGKPAQAFRAYLSKSRTLKMAELNGNGKYRYLSHSFPTAEKRYKKVYAGDVMLYGDDCLVVFYKTHKTSYRYTKIGRLVSTKGLAKVTGKKAVLVRFGKMKQAKVADDPLQGPSSGSAAAPTDPTNGSPTAPEAEFPGETEIPATQPSVDGALADEAPDGDGASSDGDGASSDGDGASSDGSGVSRDAEAEQPKSSNSPDQSQPKPGSASDSSAAPNETSGSATGSRGAATGSRDAVTAHGYTVEEVSFERDGKRIYGELYLPDAEGPLPVVVVSHGFGGNSSQVASYARAFAERGVAACAFDFCGGGRGSRSDGDTTEMSVLTEAADLNAVVDGLRAREDVDPSRLFLLGESQGGFVSTYVAATRPADVRALVALYPAYVIHDDAWNRTPDPDAIPEMMSLMGMTVGRAYNADAMSFDIYDMMPGYPGDVLIIHGTADGIVPIGYSERAAATFPSADLVRFEGAGHGFYGSDRERAAQLAVGFVEERLGWESPSSDAAGQPDVAQSLAMTVTVNGRQFSATAEDTEAGRELAARLPLTLDMRELNGVEKYAYTGEPFGGEATIPATIEAGDVMAYSGDCLVLFYADHPNPGYLYVPLARIDDPDGLAEAVGAGAASVTLEAAG